MISPLPPQRSGIAKYTYEMLEGLSQHCDVDAFVETDPAEVSAPAVVSIEHIARFETKERVRAGYDSVVFCLGNSEFHVEALSLLRKRRSGVVLAHDVRLTGLYAWTAAFRPELLPFGFLDSLRSMYGGRIPADVGVTGWLDWNEADRFGIYMAREAIGLQTAISSIPTMRRRLRGSMRRPVTRERSSGSSSCFQTQPLLLARSRTRARR